MKNYIRPEVELVKKLEHEYHANKRKLLIDNLKNSKLLKSLGIVALVGLSSYSMPRHIQGIERAYDNFCQTVEYTSEILKSSEEEVYEIPSINDLEKPEYLSERQKESLEKFFDEIKPTLE